MSSSKIPPLDLPPIDRLLQIMAQLRDPVSGCPWDREQTFETIAPYTLEEAYEVADAIASHDTDELKEELGDLLLQVAFHAQMAAEQKLFDFNDVANAIGSKLVHRHPHVFGDASADTADDVIPLWNERKAAEAKTKKPKAEGRGLPALMRAQKLHRKLDRSAGHDAAHAGHDAAQAGQADLSGMAPLLAALSDIAQNAPEKLARTLADTLWTITRFAEDKSVDLERELAVLCTEKSLQNK